MKYNAESKTKSAAFRTTLYYVLALCVLASSFHASAATPNDYNGLYSELVESGKAEKGSEPFSRIAKLEQRKPGGLHPRIPALGGRANNRGQTTFFVSVTVHAARLDIGLVAHDYPGGIHTR
jgi:hypothetical protein